MNVVKIKRLIMKGLKVKNILKSILLCASGASIAMGADQVDHYISGRVRATIQQVNRNTYATKTDVINAVETLFTNFKESKKIYRNEGDRIADALDKALFNQQEFADLDPASKKHQLSVGYITAFASLKTVYTDVTADKVFEDYSNFLQTKHNINLQQFNILQSRNIQQLLDTVVLEEENVQLTQTNNVIQNNQTTRNLQSAFNPPLISKNPLIEENNKNNDSIADLANNLFNDLMKK